MQIATLKVNTQSVLISYQQAAPFSSLLPFSAAASLPFCFGNMGAILPWDLCFGRFCTEQWSNVPQAPEARGGKNICWGVAAREEGERGQRPRDVLGTANHSFIKMMPSSYCVDGTTLWGQKDELFWYWERSKLITIVLACFEQFFHQRRITVLQTPLMKPIISVSWTLHTAALSVTRWKLSR